MKFTWPKRLLGAALVACTLLQTAALAAEAQPLEVAAQTGAQEMIVTEPAGGMELPAEQDEETVPPEEEPAEPAPTETEPAEPAPTDTEPAEPAPTETEPGGEEPEIQDPLEGYSFPDNWAGEPLRFAVRYGILKGRGGYDLDPTGNTTRAEMATMLVRLLGATEEADLSGYTDMSPKAWYYDEIGIAVNLGIFVGTSKTTMSPQRLITRQEAFTVLARAFGLYPTDASAYTCFRDSGELQPFARNAVSALYETGGVTGYEDGTLRPKAYITRQEVAALFYKLLDEIRDTPEDMPASGRVLYRGTEPLPQGYSLDGTLILGAGQSGAVCLENCSVTGRLVLRCAPGAQVTLEGTRAGELSAPSAVDVSGGTFPRVVSAGAGSTLNLSGTTADLYAPCTLNGTFEKVNAYTPGSTILGTIGRLNLTAKAGGGTTTLDGQADSVAILGNSSVLNGSGYARCVIVCVRNYEILLNYGEFVDQIDWGLTGVTVTLSGPASITPTNNTVQIDARFTGFIAGYGTINGGRTVRLQWYLNDQLLSTQDDFYIKDNIIASFSHTFGAQEIQEEVQVFRVVLTCGSETVEGSFTVASDSSMWKYQQDYEAALNTVETVNIEGRTLVRTYLYSDKNRSSVLRTVAAGTSLTHLYYSGADGAPGQVRLSDGTVGWMNWADYLVSREDYTQYWDYSVGTKEGFVNQKGYSSSTGYLIWLSLKTQKVNIFQGSKGNWKLIRVCPCATGKNTTPTVSGVYSIIYKTYRWRFDEYVDGKYMEDYSRVYYVSGFWGGQAFHSRLYYADDTLYDGTIGTPVSHGCVRMMDEDCRYIYESMPSGTTVVNY
ncbi:MAG: S-layer homology domain-containing protein [Firmicutes bacterium]|nr:S-layer homology domain-containing protein [Bacillota bacterium]